MPLVVAAYVGFEFESRRSKMDWALISVVGAMAGAIGVVLTKVLDIVWLQRILRGTENRKWFREQRLRVYTKLAEDLLSMGTNMDARENAFSGYALAAEAMLLVPEDKLANEIEHFFTMLSNIFSEGRKADDDPTKRSEEHLEGAYQIVLKESRRLVKELRRSLHE